MENDIVAFEDGNGSTYKLKRTVYDGQTFDLINVLQSPDVLLPKLAQYEPRADEIWLHSYQKAGTHWVYEIIGILLRGSLDPMPYTKGKDFIELQKDALENDGKRILNTHMHPSLLPKCIFDKCKNIVAVRNPKSVAISSYHFFNIVNGFGYKGTFSGYLKSFMDLGAIGEYSDTWYSYYCSFWKNFKSSPNVHFVFYEDLKKNPVDTVMAISEFLGLERDRTFCEGVVELTSFKNMKNNTGKQRPTFSIQRKGTIDDWKNEFTVAENEIFDADYKEKMKDFQDLAEMIQFS